MTGAPDDRAAVRVHDIGLRIVKNEAGEVGFEVWVGGGLGRTPIIGVAIRKFLPKEHLLSYLEAILRVYNLLGRRDNIYKARIKILVQATGGDKFAAQVEEEWEKIKDGPLHLPQAEIERIHRYFAPPAYEALPDIDPAFETAKLFDNTNFFYGNAAHEGGLAKNVDTVRAGDEAYLCRSAGRGRRRP